MFYKIISKRSLIFFSVGAVIGLAVYFYVNQQGNPTSPAESPVEESGENEGGLDTDVNPLSIEALRAGEYPGSDLVVEQALESGSNYDRSIVSYKSEGLKIYALLTVPQGEKPEGGWPVIVFNHGYIPPAEYRTTEKYIAYTDAFSRNGYIVLRSDYRGHGNSEGIAAGGYGSNDYTIDVMNAVASIKKYKDANPEKIGMWGHSMGGHITLRNMVVRDDIKAGVVWAGVVASYPDLINNWRRGSSVTPSIPSGARRWRQALTEQYGTAQSNPTFWNSISSNSYLQDISGPIQIHHGTADTSVPVAFSTKLDEQLAAAGQEKELYIYEGDDHNLANNLGIALDRSVAFFDTHVK
ncbi:MAG: alpha/beta fold hydrolase [Candidatus Levybacteria bacterium]|nr:alpha/beta fold hydrolase [Candidatus Levybacteria bacterium]